MIPAIYVTGIALAPGGAWPLKFQDHYALDENALGRYVAAARSDRDFDRGWMRGSRWNCSPRDRTVQPHRTADHGHRAPARRLPSRRGRRVVADSGGRSVDGSCQARDAMRVNVLGSHSTISSPTAGSSLRSCRARSHRCVLPRWRTDRRRSANINLVGTGDLSANPSAGPARSAPRISTSWCRA